MFNKFHYIVGINYYFDNNHQYISDCKYVVFDYNMDIIQLNYIKYNLYYSCYKSYNSHHKPNNNCFLNNKHQHILNYMFTKLNLNMDIDYLCYKKNIMYLSHYKLNTLHHKVNTTNH